MSHTDSHESPPPFRRLRGYSIDPSLSSRMETAGMNETVFQIPWEESLAPGPCGEYVEVIDYDPASECLYDPVDLNDPHLLAQDGVAPSAGNPKFHQQMVYAVTMTTIKNFERALGRRAQWSAHRWDEEPSIQAKIARNKQVRKPKGVPYETYVQKLRVYPHALREANAYYSPQKRALLFGYFSAMEVEGGDLYPHGTVFGCLSHDIVAHETTHALLDGMHPRFIEASQPDSLAFHEAFADIVALFQHFTFPEVLRHQIARTRGNLETESLLGELAQEFGRATGGRGALRGCIGGKDANGVWQRQKPDPTALDTIIEPHSRGAILVAAVFDAFLAIYNSRIADLKRIASDGTGIMREGDLHPDLVNRLAYEASKSARVVLNICIRALDYCPPVDISFGDYLRALITADIDIEPRDPHRYRLCFIDSFRARGIYPRALRTLSEESLQWDPVSDVAEEEPALWAAMKSTKGFSDSFRWCSSREDAWKAARAAKAMLHGILNSGVGYVREFEELTGLVFSKDTKLSGFGGRRIPPFEVHSLSSIQRVRPDGTTLNQVVGSVLQHRRIKIPKTADHEGDEFTFRGGCTIIIDLDAQKLRYCVTKPINESGAARLERYKDYRRNQGSTGLAATYFGELADLGLYQEPFALLHAHTD